MVQISYPLVPLSSLMIRSVEFMKSVNTCCSLIIDALHWKWVDEKDSGCSNAKTITIKAKHLELDYPLSATGNA